MSEMKLTKRQEAQIYCIKHGHAKYFWSFFGYAHCGRCGEQIGDSLAGVFSGDGMVKVGHECETCNKAKESLSKLDLEILKRLEADLKGTYDYDKILEGIVFS